MTASTAETSSPSAWPAIPTARHRDTYDTLHMWTQIVGKTRLALSPSENHWWHTALYLTPRGLTTSPMPCGPRTFATDFDFIDHQLLVRASDGATRALPLGPQSVADFYAAYTTILRELGIEAHIRPVPVEVQTAIPFAEDRQHASYDPGAAHDFWLALSHADRALKRFRGRFQGKASPVHVFWGSFDLAATRFSGRPAPRHPGGAPNCPDWVMVEAYSHECSSCGFWLGGGPVDGPAFYAYAYPEPAGFADRPVRPESAFYSREMREFILPYDAVRASDAPERAVLDFCQSTYGAAADLARWDRAALERPAVESR